uniref:Aminotransferase-like plant mobile domain-containing protein n=1 Tax=Fagus sylvatica TaxID=28930 RepID=A0A2N9FSB1_FAGSY
MRSLTSFLSQMLAGCQYCLLADFSLQLIVPRVRRQFGFDQEVPVSWEIARVHCSGSTPLIDKGKARPRIPHHLMPHIIRDVRSGSAFRRCGWLAPIQEKETPSKDSSTRASKKKKTTAARASRGVIILDTAAQDPLLVEKSAAQGVFAPMSKKPMRKTRAGKRTFVPPAFPSVPTSIAARVAARKSTHGIVYSKKRDDLDSSSSSSDSSDPSGAVAERAGNEDAEIGAAETVSDTEVIVAEVNSTDESSASSVSFGGEDEHTTAGVVTSAARAVETTPITITSSGGTAQGHPSESGRHADPSLLDSSPSTRHYVRRARRGSIVSIDSERTISATVRVPTPSSPLHESGGTAPTLVVVAAVVPAAVIAQDSEAVPAAAEEVPGSEKVPAHIPDIQEEVAASEDPIQADVTPGSDVLVMEEAFVQDSTDDISMEDMADTHDSYDAVLAGTEDHVAGTQAIDMEVTAPVTAHTSPTKTAGSGNEAIAEEERRHQTAAVESAIRGQLGLLSVARSATLGSFVLADMDAFFREFDRMSVSSRHAEHFWIFDDAKADFEDFRVPQGGVWFLKALWEKYGSCSSYFRLGVHVGSSMLTFLCCVLAHMEHTRLEDVIEVHILEWKVVVQEVIGGGFKFSFILDYLRRLAHDMFSRRILVELRAIEARAAALREALNMVAPNPWDLASARGVFADPHAELALYGLLA